MNQEKRSRGIRRHSRLSWIPLGCAALGLAPSAHSQYAPPSPPRPFAGFLNEWMRQQDPYLSAWDLGGSLRMRFESKQGMAVAGVPGSIDFRDHGADVTNDYFLTRLRYRVGYTGKWWNAMVEGRSSFAVDDDRWASTLAPARRGEGPESDTFDLHQAYVTFGNHKEFPLSLKVGRQELSYGEERVVGAFGWNNIGRVFDAAKLRWQTEWFAADFFSGRVIIPEDNRFNVANDYEWFSGMYASIANVPKHSLDVYFLSRNASPSAATAEPFPQVGQPSARDIYTVGLRLKSKPGELGPWDYTLETMGQFGDFKDPRAGAPAVRLDHRAYAFVAQGGYTFAKTTGPPRIGLEYAYGSGDGNPKDGKHTTFENLFPTNHKFYGYADLASLQNLHDVRPVLTFKPHPRLSMALEGHLFWLADTSDSFYNVAGAARGGTAATPAGTNFGVNPGYSNFVGSELDYIAGWALTRFAQIEGGYSHFFHGSYISQSLSSAAVGSRDADWAYLQLTVNF
ncbi:MAG: alginate export family protein [Verrucomicrobia bacterium]|nr:alginate export family protein [Verrucomicrobiota bacterium]